MSTETTARGWLNPKIVAVAVAIVAIIVAGRVFHLAEVFARALDQIRAMGPIGPIVFIALYIVACVAFVPGSVLTLGAGAVFGVIAGTFYVWIGATLGATAAFLTGRYLARGWVAAKLAGDERFRAIDNAVGREGWKIVGLTRLSPVFPFNLLNYAFGLTGVSLRDYVVATALGIIPGTMMYVYIGSVGGALARSGASGASRTPAQWALYVVGLAATVTVAVYVSRLGARALRERT